MTDKINTDEFAARRDVLATTMQGFDGLLLVVQALLTQWSLVTGEIWECDHDTTLSIAHDTVMELRSMTKDWGVEQ